MAWNVRYRNNVPKVVEENCKQAWGTNQANIDVCYRQAYGGLSLARLLAKVGGTRPPEFETPNKTRVGKTNVDHPEAQCRLDTYFQGSLCAVPFNLKVIPGKDLGSENNSPKAEALASEVSCFDYKGHKLGFRPPCWFKNQNGG